MSGRNTRCHREVFKKAAVCLGTLGAMAGVIAMSMIYISPRAEMGPNSYVCPKDKYVNGELYGDDDAYWGWSPNCWIKDPSQGVPYNYVAYAFNLTVELANATRTVMCNLICQTMSELRQTIPDLPREPMEIVNNTRPNDVRITVAVLCGLLVGAIGCAVYETIAQGAAARRAAARRAAAERDQRALFLGGLDPERQPLYGATAIVVSNSASPVRSPVRSVEDGDGVCR